MKKNEFRLLESMIDNKSYKRELAYAKIDFNSMEIVGTDTRRAIKIKLRENEVYMCSGVHYMHKKILKAFTQLMSNDIEYKFENNHLVVGDEILQLNTLGDKVGFNYPKLELEYKYDTEYISSNIMYIDFDTTHNNTHINSEAFKTLQEFGDAKEYIVKTKAQVKDVAGLVKIIGRVEDEDYVLVTRFEVLLMGLVYIPPQPTLFD